MNAQEQAYITAQYKASIERIPDEQLPWANVRAAMLDYIERGATLYAYGSGSATMIYHEQPLLYMKCHFTPGEWGAAYGFLDEYANPDGTLRYDHGPYWIVEADGTLTDRTDGKEHA